MEAANETGYWQELAKLDKTVMQPVRLAVLDMLEDNGGKADFQNLRNCIGLTSGNLQTHLAKLESAGYVEIEKSFVDRRPRTSVVLTRSGASAIEEFAGVIEEWARRRKLRTKLRSPWPSRNR